MGTSTSQKVKITRNQCNNLGLKNVKKKDCSSNTDLTSQDKVIAVGLLVLSEVLIGLNSHGCRVPYDLQSWVSTIQLSRG